MTNAQKNKQSSRIDCRKCTHYYVTWDSQFPHGCRAMKFKSKALPSAMVRRSSAMACQVFESKEKPLRP